MDEDGLKFDDGIELLARMGAAKDASGTAWDVTICEPGPTKNGWFIPEDALRDAESLFEGVDVNLFEMGDLATHVPGPLFEIKSLLTKNKVGWIDGVRYAAGEGLKGVLHFLDSAQWIGKNLLTAAQSGGRAYGLSYDCPVRATKAEEEGKTVFRILKFLGADSVDIVTRPAAGGKFNRAVASIGAHSKRQAQNGGKLMDKEQLWELIKEKRPDLLKGKDFEAVKDEEVLTLARMAMEPAPKDETPAKPDVKDPDAPKPLTQDDLTLFRCSMSLEKALEKSELPKTAATRIRASFADRIFEDADLTRAIADEKDYLATVADAQKPKDDDGQSSGIKVGLGTIERAQMAVDRMFGMTKEDMESLCRMERLDRKPFFEDVRNVQDYVDYDQVPAFSGLREMYAFFTGDKEVTGAFMRKNLPPDLRSQMDITSATFSYVLGNTLGRRLVNDYRATDFGEDQLVSIRKPVKDFRQQEAVLVGYFGDLDTVDPEAADFAEIAAVSDEESTYTLAQKGNILTITRKTIINDDLSMIQRLVSRLGRAARRTHAKYVWGFFADNGTCSDGTAWFTEGHSNLGAAALAHATALIAYLALATMTEKDSGEPIGLLDDPGIMPTLVYPPALMATAEQIVKEDFYYSTNDLTDKLPNPLKGKVKGKMVSLFSDTNNWGLILPPSLIDIVEMGYLNGRQEPEMFMADSPQSEQVFVADKIRHKIRHEYAGAIIDYRSGYKAVVA